MCMSWFEKIPKTNYHGRSLRTSILFKYFDVDVHQCLNCGTLLRTGDKSPNVRCNSAAGRTTTNEELEDMLEQGNPAVFTQVPHTTHHLDKTLILEQFSCRHGINEVFQ